LIEKDTYKTLAKPSSEIIFKEKNSKFYGYAFPIKSEEEIKIHLDYLKKNIMALYIFVTPFSWEQTK